MGRPQRTKQADPLPLPGSSAHPNSELHVGKRKANLEARAAREGKTIVPRGRGRGKEAKKDNRQGMASGRGGDDEVRSKKRVKRTKGANAAPGGDEDDMEGLEEEDDYEDDDEEEGAVDTGLEAARAYVLLLYGGCSLSQSLTEIKTQCPLRCCRLGSSYGWI